MNEETDFADGFIGDYEGVDVHDRAEKAITLFSGAIHVVIRVDGSRSNVFKSHCG